MGSFALSKRRRISRVGQYQRRHCGNFVLRDVASLCTRGGKFLCDHVHGPYVQVGAH
jgi:hypothetical protein